MHLDKPRMKLRSEHYQTLEPKDKITVQHTILEPKPNRKRTLESWNSLQSQKDTLNYIVTENYTRDPSKETKKTQQGNAEG